MFSSLIKSYRQDVPYKKEIEDWYRNVSKNRYFNIDYPLTFNEKIQWLKLYDSTPIKTRLADKYLVREWVKEKIGEKYLIKLLGVYDTFDEIDFKKLPKQFVIKCNHGCGYNIIVKDKSKLDIKEAREKINAWMKENYAFRFGCELQYRDIKPKIIVEKYLENKKHNFLTDYKFYCFNGDPKYLQIISDRTEKEHKTSFYDQNWTKQIFYDNLFEEKVLEKPQNYQQMINLAQKLSQDFSYVRVDFYVLDDGTIKFGEMTFTPASGSMQWSSHHINCMLGKLIKLPKLAYNINSKKYYKIKKNIIQLIFNRLKFIAFETKGNKKIIYIFGIKITLKHK